MIDLIRGLMDAIVNENERRLLEDCIPVASYSIILNDLTDVSYDIHKAEDFFDILKEWIPMLMNVGYLLQNCEGSLEDDKELLDFYADISEFSAFVNT
mmetsp:Transcript_28801/g.27729  ORF Transcript_28801/g.27729 Transcript_28801/m.27729 type:complete len:98 (+) Transcript_28801:626-919(+)